MTTYPVPVTTVDAARLAVRVGAKGADQLADVETTLAATVALLNDTLARAFREVPVDLLDDWVLRVGRAKWDSRKVQHGAGGQLATVGGEQGVRPPRDPLAVIAPELGRYVVGLA